jgi:hypothetical protein
MFMPSFRESKVIKGTNTLTDTGIMIHNPVFLYKEEK